MNRNLGQNNRLRTTRGVFEQVPIVGPNNHNGVWLRVADDERTGLVEYRKKESSVSWNSRGGNDQRRMSSLAVSIPWSGWLPHAFGQRQTARSMSHHSPNRTPVWIKAPRARAFFRGFPRVTIPRASALEYADSRSTLRSTGFHLPRSSKSAQVFTHVPPEVCFSA